MAIPAIPVKIDIATKAIITEEGFPVEISDLPPIEYGIEVLINATYNDVDINSATPLTPHAFSASDLFAVKGDHDFNVDNELMFLAQEIIGNPPAWAGLTVTKVGDRVLSTGGNWFLCQVAGKTGASEPTWDNDLGDTTTDGTVTWIRVYNNDGINQPGDWGVGGTADKALGQVSYRFNTRTTKFKTFMNLLSIRKPQVKNAVIQFFVLEAGSAEYSMIGNSRFLAGGTVESLSAMPSPGDPIYLNETQSYAKFISRDEFNLKNAIDITISGGAITRNNSVHNIIPESGTTDDLDAISGLLDGECCIIKLKNPVTDTITIKHGTSAGDVATPDGNDVTLTGYETLLIIGGPTYATLMLPFNPDAYLQRQVQDAGSGATVLTAFNGLKLLRVDTSGGSATITLHSVTGWTGELEILKNNASNTVNITGTVNGVANPSFNSVGSMRIINDGNDNFITPEQITP